METVNHPKHYSQCSVMGVAILNKAGFPLHHLDKECIDVIIEMNLDFCLGNCIKYLWRVGEKKKLFFFDNTLEDLKKSEWYLKKYIQISEEKGYQYSENYSWIYSLNRVICLLINDLEK